MLSACDSERSHPQVAFGSITMSLPAVPSGVSCLVVTFAGSLTVERQQALTPGESATFTFEALPVGTGMFSASAYDAPCAELGTMEPSWRSAPVEATVTPDATIALTLQLARVSEPDDAGPMMMDAGPSLDADAPDGDEPDAGQLPPGVTLIDISAGRGEGTGIAPSAVIDTKNRKLLVSASDATREGRLALYRCELDGTACSYSDISTGQRANSGYRSQALVDTVNDKLLVVTDDRSGPNPYAVGLTRCELDGTACSYASLSGSAYVGPAFSAATLDTVGRKLIAATSSELPPNPAGLIDLPMRQGGIFRCELDGSGCVFQPGIIREPSVLADSRGGKLYQAGSAWTLKFPSAYVQTCQLDGTMCTVSTPGLSSSSSAPTNKTSLVMDERNGRLLAILSWTTPVPYVLRALRCSLDGAACELLSSTIAGGPTDGHRPIGLFDATLGQLLVVVTSEESPWLHRCGLDLTGCTSTPLSVGGPYAQTQPSAVLDETNHYLLVVTQSRSGRVALTRVNL